MAIDHIATPAVPPATMIAPRLSSEGDCPAGVSIFFVTSYAAKYLHPSSQEIERAEGTHDVRCTTGAISRDGRDRATEHATQTTFTVQVLDDVEHALVLRTTLSLALNLVEI